MRNYSVSGELWEFYWIHYHGCYSERCSGDLMRMGKYCLGFEKRWLKCNLSQRFFRLFFVVAVWKRFAYIGGKKRNNRQSCIFRKPRPGAYQAKDPFAPHRSFFA